MPNVEQLVVSWSRTCAPRACLAWLCLALSFFACTTTHVDTSTETGNPPVVDVPKLDENKIALVVGNDGVRIVGQAGAVSPGGATVELTLLGTSETTRVTSKADGSFEIMLDSTPDAVVELRAANGDKQSSTVYVTRGGASVGSGDDEKLTCMQRINLASQAIGNVLVRADNSCTSAADCRFVPNKTLCTDSCGDALVSRAAATSIQSAVGTLDNGLCASFAADGCQVIALPCIAPPPGPIACVAGRCTQQARPLSIACPSCLTQDVEWGPTSGQITNRISNCDTLRRNQTGALPCEGAVPHCGSGAGATIEDLLAALANADVQQALATGGTIGGPPAPGGLSTQVHVGMAAFVISSCVNGDCGAIPPGVQALREVLNRIADQVQCAPPACPPNAIYVQDACVSCGIAGGCAQTIAGCAVVCSGDSSPCVGNMLGNSCSARNICEAGPCI